MSTTKEDTRDFDLSFIKDMLETQIRRMTVLRDKLSDKGKDLFPDEKILIRQCLLNPLQDHQREISMFFLLGEKQDFRSSVQSLEKFGCFI